MRGLLVLACCVACSKPPAEARGTEPPQPPPPPPPSDPVTAGKPLTADMITSLPSSFIESYDPWDEGFGKLVQRLGPPTHIDGDDYYWAAVTDNVCAYVMFQKVDGASVNMAGELIRPEDPRGVRPYRFEANGPMANREMCLDLAGAESPLEN